MDEQVVPSIMSFACLCHVRLCPTLCRSIFYWIPADLLGCLYQTQKHHLPRETKNAANTPLPTRTPAIPSDCFRLNLSLVGVSTLELLRLEEALSRFASDFRIFPNVLPLLRALPTLLPPALARPVAPPTSPLYPPVERRMLSSAT